MERINVLHLSDAHISKRRLVDQQIVLTALFDDLARLCDSDLAPHYVVISGDLVDDPDEPDSYNRFVEELLFPLLDVTSIDLDNFIFTPGNHDVSRAICQRFPLELEAIGKRLGDHEYFNELYESHRFPQLVQEKFSAYTSFIRSLSSTHASKDNLFYNVWDYPTNGIAFVVLNSSLLSLASLAGPEHGRLSFPDLAANKALLVPEAGALVVSVQHHPLAWLEDASAIELQRAITHKSAMHLYGHLHEAIPTTLSSTL
jgi:predicted MPP superfamily phosphohydrolase